MFGLFWMTLGVWHVIWSNLERNIFTPVLNGHAWWRFLLLALSHCFFVLCLKILSWHVFAVTMKLVTATMHTFILYSHWSKAFMVLHSHEHFFHAWKITDVVVWREKKRAIHSEFIHITKFTPVLSSNHSVNAHGAHVCDCVSERNKTSSAQGSILRLHNNSVTAGPVGCLYADTPALSPLLLTYACPHWLIKPRRPCRMRCTSADEGEIEGPTCISCVSPGFWGDLLLTQEWKPQIKVFVLTKDKWDFSFAQTVQDSVGLLKVSGKKKSPGRHL